MIIFATDRKEGVSLHETIFSKSAISLCDCLEERHPTSIFDRFFCYGGYNHFTDCRTSGLDRR